MCSGESNKLNDSAGWDRIGTEEKCMVFQEKSTCSSQISVLPLGGRSRLRFYLPEEIYTCQ